MSDYASLPTITALARAGAVERAWALFNGSGHAARNDPAALAVKGRLLKSRARLAPARLRTPGFAAAAQAYAAANALQPAPYLAINAATLHLLAGDGQNAARIAREVLAMLDAPDPPSDTPYYLAATRAEALLLLNDQDGACQAMEAAVAAAPEGWTDRAVTLAQLEEVCAAQQRDCSWLDPYRPPASLHFAGHMGVASAGEAEQAIRTAVDLLLRTHPVGFAYGALAAGADIVVAERLLAAGAELHIVLPSQIACFEEQSVKPAGDDWTERFRAVIERAASVRSVAETQTGVHDPLATYLAGEMAIGAAMLNAQRYDAHAMQLALVDEAGGGANTRRQTELWTKCNAGEQVRQVIPRDARVEALFPPEIPDPARRLAAQIAVRIGHGQGLAVPSSALIAESCEPVWRVLGGLPASAVRAAPLRWDLLIEDLTQAVEVILALAAIRDAAGQPVVSLAAHYGIACCVQDDASGALVPYGPGTDIADRLLGLSLGGMATVSEDFATALAVRRIGGVRCELYLDHDPAFGGAIYSLFRQVQ